MPENGCERAMPSRFPYLRFCRDMEARLREIAERNPHYVTPHLVQLADEVAAHATELKDALIADGLLSPD